MSRLCYGNFCTFRSLLNNSIRRSTSTPTRILIFSTQRSMRIWAHSSYFLVIFLIDRQSLSIWNFFCSIWSCRLLCFSLWFWWNGNRRLLEHFSFVYLDIQREIVLFNSLNNSWWFDLLLFFIRRIFILLIENSSHIVLKIFILEVCDSLSFFAHIKCAFV